VKILLSEGSSLASRQVAGQLAQAGHRVEILSPDPICLGRFTRHVRRVHRVPSFGGDPLRWLDAALAIYRSGGFDVLFPTQEQVAVLSHSARRLESAGVRTAVPPFEALRAVQDKVTASATLGALRIPHPPTAFLGSPDELRAWDTFPVFIKIPIGTATTGVRRGSSAAELDAVATELQASGFFHGGTVIAQESAEGPLAMVQSVFVRGEMVAAHANLRVREGTGGGASHKRSVDEPTEITKHVEALGRSLGWHGALSADAILTASGPVFIDINPRLVEPGNAWRAGVDLTGAMLEVACGGAPAAQPPGRPGVNTHQLLLAVLGAGAQGRGRRGAVAEILAALAHAGSYRGSAEELTPVQRDPQAAVPVLFATLALLIRPALWRRLSGGAVADYALTPAGWRSLLDTAPT
jgi:glutathione synthase/RimK-type ligase-like ATP-grasp enzyme